MQQFYFVIIPEKWEKVETDPMSINAGRKVPLINDHSFRTYTDTKGALNQGTGRSVQYTVSVDGRGQPKGKYFKISQQHNAILCNDTDRDMNGVSMFDFIKNYPHCLGSPNGTYVSDGKGGLVHANALFRLAEDEKDAEIMLDARIQSAEAIASANALDDDTLSEVAAALPNPAFGKPGKMMKHDVVEWAAKNPKDYFKVLNSGDRAVRALVRKALADGLFSTRGTLIFWGDTMIGTDENSAVKTLVDDPKILEGLKDLVNLKTEAKNGPKKRGPKPKN